MPLTLPELLHPQVITKTISQVTVGRGELSRFLKFDLGSSSIHKLNGRYAAYRIFNSTREPLAARVPGTGPAITAPNPTGERQIAMMRFHEKIVLDAERLSNLANIDGPSSNLDIGGQSYIKRQTDFLGQKANMATEFLSAGFLRGIFYLVQSGDNWLPAFTSSGNYITVDLQLASGNKSQLNMLAGGNIIDVPWDNPQAPIVQHCLNVRAAMVQLSGMPLQNVLVNSTMWGNVINNLSVRTVGGAVQSPFDSFSYSDTKVDGYGVAGGAVARLKALPWLKWIIIDETVALGGGGDTVSGGTATLNKVVPDTVAVFMPDPDVSWCQMYHGGEIVQEDYGKKPSVKVGLSAWARWDIEPSTYNIVCLLNALPVAYRTNAWAYATVTGF